MSVVELVCCLAIVGICMGCLMAFSGEMISNLSIELSKVELDCFLENQRLEAVRRSKTVELIYNYRQRKLFSNTGDVLEGCLWNNLEDFRIIFNGEGSIAILSGSTTLCFENGTVLTIQPVTGKVTY
ncbi:MAG TPA: hypothetical protein PLM80_08680 [Mesotoga sp.]|nr:hypothetical protein [Mesotoga sp.]MDI9375307.1 hypothetical protein [Thermotogota bacterium]NLX33619.1 hypothetical protein [Thermotogaceae bacterium]MDD4040487.1 hypothetical protein [Mesotoga sp.]MDD5744370.1 hypothetical protein [Mesotoga sp.]